MKDNFEASLKAVLEHEGGYVNHPRDPGGPTNFGVTKAVYDAYRKQKGAKPQSVKHISMEEVRTIYRKQYWDAIGADDLARGYDYALFDIAVNSGPKRAREWQGGYPTIDTLCNRRMVFLKGLPTWDTFGKGWTRRVEGVRALAHKMAKMPDFAPPPPVKPAPLPPRAPVSPAEGAGAAVATGAAGLAYYLQVSISTIIIVAAVALIAWVIWRKVKTQ